MLNKFKEENVEAVFIISLLFTHYTNLHTEDTKKIFQFSRKNIFLSPRKSCVASKKHKAQQHHVEMYIRR